MKILVSWLTLTANATLPIALLLISQTHAATTTVAHWTFNETDGPVVNTNAPADVDASVSHHGWVGYSANAGDDNEVDRNGSGAAFNGNRNSIILIDDANHANFNPGDGSLVVSMEFLLNRSALNNEELAPKETWNLIQKGRFNNTGGQWKMQIRKGPKGRLFLQCLINDNKPDTKRVASQIPLQDTWVVNNHVLTGRCTLNRQVNELKVEVTDLTSGKTVSSAPKAISLDFGAVAPEAGECGTSESFGGNVAIGNKPLCPDQELDTNDAFQGEVFNVLIERF